PPRVHEVKRPRQRFRCARGSERCRTGRIGEPAALQEAQQRADAGETAAERLGTGTLCPSCGEEGAQIGRSEFGDVGKAWRAAAMACHELQELPAVALI